MLNLKHFPDFLSQGVSIRSVMVGGLRCMEVEVVGSGEARVWRPRPDGSGWEFVEKIHTSPASVPGPVVFE